MVKFSAVFFSLSIVVAIVGYIVATVPNLKGKIFVFSAWMLAIFKENQFLQTFVFGSIGGSVVYFVSTGSRMLYYRIYAMFRSDITIRNTDPNYAAVVDFITDKFLNDADGARSSMQVTTKKKKVWKIKILFLASIFIFVSMI